MASLYESDLQKAVNEAASKILPPQIPQPSSPALGDPRDPYGFTQLTDQWSSLDVSGALPKTTEATQRPRQMSSRGAVYDPYGMTGRGLNIAQPSSVEAAQAASAERMKETFGARPPVGSSKFVEGLSGIPGAAQPVTQNTADPVAATAGVTTEAAALPSTLPKANSLTDPTSLDRNEIAAMANRGLPAQAPTVDFGEGNYTTPKELRGSPEARANAWSFALDRGLADPNQNYTRTQRDEILMKAKKEREKEIGAWNKKISGLKEKIRVNADARNLISDQVLNAAKLGPEAGTAAHARAQQIREGLPKAVKQYGRDVITALNDPASLPQEKRDKIFGALNISPNETPQATALRSSVDSLVSINPAQPNLPDGSRKAQEGGQFANAVLNQAEAMGVDMASSAPFKAYVEALNGVNGASLSGRGKDLDKLAQAASLDFQSRMKAATSGMEMETARTKLAGLKLGTALDVAKMRYYSTKREAAGLTPTKAMDTVTKYVDDNGKEALQGIINTVDKNGPEALSAADQLVYGSFLLTQEALDINQKK